MNTSELVPLEAISVDGRFRRGIREESVLALMESFRTVGQLQPITVYTADNDTAQLVTGRHRLEAARRLNWDDINAVFVDVGERQRRLIELAENLHRADLDTQERAEHIAEWVRLTEEKQLEKVAQVAPVSKGGRGKEGGIRAATRELGLERTEVQRAIKIAEKTTPEAKVVAKEAGLANNQTALLKIAAAPAERQVEVVAEIHAGKAARRVRPAIVEDECADTDEYVEDPENHRVAYLIRADQAIQFAFFKVAPVTSEIINVARQVADAWSNLAAELEPPKAYLPAVVAPALDDLDIPEFLDRRAELKPQPTAVDRLSHAIVELDEAFRAIHSSHDRATAIGSAMHTLRISNRLNAGNSAVAMDGGGKVSTPTFLLCLKGDSWR
jgi:ParB family chromosome partitioning protein